MLCISAIGFPVRVEAPPAMEGHIILREVAGADGGLEIPVAIMEAVVTAYMVRSGRMRGECTR
jgi:hypothetical protein